MKHLAIFLLTFVYSILTLSCGPTDRSKLNFREEVVEKDAGSEQQKENSPDYEFTGGGNPEIILPMHPLPGMSDSAKAAIAFDWMKSAPLWVRFRLSMAPFVRSNRDTYSYNTYDYLMRLEKHKVDSGLKPNYPYYMVPVASDYYRDVCPVDDKGVCQCNAEQLKNFMAYPKNLYLDPVVARNLLKDPQVKGLYIHELMAFSNNEIDSKNKFNCPKKGPEYKTIPILWGILKEYAAAAKEFDKKIIWNDAGDEGAWKWLLDVLNSAGNSTPYDQAGAQSLFNEYSNVIVPLWANNRNTSDLHEKDTCHARADAKSVVKRTRLFCDKIENSTEAIKAIALKYKMNRFGASIQDWHTVHTFVTPDSAAKDAKYQECVRRDIINYTAKAQKVGSRVFEFESYWARDGFFKALKLLKDSIRDEKQAPLVGNWSDQVCFPVPPEEKKK